MNIDNLTDEHFIQPTLKILGDEEYHTKKEVEEKISQHFHLSIKDVNKKYPAGKNKLKTRIGTTLHRLRRDGWLVDKDHKPGKGIFRITKRGLKILNNQDRPVAAKSAKVIIHIKDNVNTVKFDLSASMEARLKKYCNKNQLTINEGLHQLFDEAMK